MAPRGGTDKNGWRHQWRHAAAPIKIVEGVIEPMALECRKPSGKSCTMKMQKSTFTKVTGPDISMLGAHAFKERSGQRSNPQKMRYK